MINETIPRIFHELDAMNRNDPPPRSAEELWKLAKKSITPDAPGPAGPSLLNVSLLKKIHGDNPHLPETEHQVQLL